MILTPRLAACQSFRRLFVPRLALAGVIASSALAGPIDPSHVVQDLDANVAGAAAMLDVPGSNRMLVASRTGDLRLVTGNRLVDQLVIHLPVASACAEHGILEMAWDPTAPGASVFVSYVATDLSLTVARVDLPSAAITPVFRLASAAPCGNVGGGLAFAADGALLLGVGDYGDPARAVQTAVMTGKILRMARDGAVPAPPLASNPIPGSRVLGLGVRNPVAITTDALGASWFLDVGPGRDDELNRVQGSARYGWDAAMQAGFLGAAPTQDPYFAWSSSIEPSGLVAYDDTRLGALRGQLVVVSQGGRMSAIEPVGQLAGQSTETLLFQRDPTGPQSFTSATSLPDGAVGVTSGTGALHRLTSRRGAPYEPSSRDEVVPLALRKTGAQGFDLAVERVAPATEVGVHLGDLMALAGSGYTHQLAPPAWHPITGSADDSVVHVPLTEADIGGPGGSVYVMVSARRDCSESGVGQDSAGTERPITPPAACSGIAVLGNGTHDVRDVVMTEIASVANQLALPRDLAFHPEVPGELWVINRVDHSMIIIEDTGLPTQTSSRRADGMSGQHFMAQPSALAFGPGMGSFATIHEEDQFTQGPPPGGTPADFMGPTLWTSDSGIFDGGDDSHLDMLHNSPNGMGIAWEQANAYWVFDGWHSSLTRYDFVQPHALSGTFHGDGIVVRYVEGQVARVPDIPSHVIYDPVTRLVYAADTGNARIVALDPSTGTNAGPVSPNYDGDSQTKVVGATLTTVVVGADVGMVAPSGLELHDGMLFVSDNATSRILALDLAGGLVDWLDTGFPPGTLMGMAFDPRDDSLYVVDAVDNRVLRIAPR